MYFFLKSPNSKDETLIFLKYYISRNEGRFVYSTKLKINPENWNFETKSVKIKRGKTDLALLDRKIGAYKRHLETLLSNYGYNDILVTKKQLEVDFDLKFKPKIVHPKSYVDFDSVIKEMVRVKMASKLYTKSTQTKYNNLDTKLKKFEKSMNVKLEYDSFLSDGNFVSNWLSFCYNKLGHTDNTVGRSLGLLKTALIYARKKGYHSISDLSHLKKFDQETDDIALTKDELLTYYNYDFGESKYLGRVRDVFCIGCFSGQRYSDYSIFNKSDYHNGFIEKRALKTKTKSIIPVDSNPRLKELLDKYDWNLPKISDQKFRDYLKLGLKQTGALDYVIKKVMYRGTQKIETNYQKWEIVGTHTARRTFITLALENGATYKEIMTMAGIKKVETVIKYDKVTPDRLDKTVSKIFK